MPQVSPYPQTWPWGSHRLAAAFLTQCLVLLQLQPLQFLCHCLLLALIHLDVRADAALNHRTDSRNVLACAEHPCCPLCHAVLSPGDTAISGLRATSKALQCPAPAGVTALGHKRGDRALAPCDRLVVVLCTQCPGQMLSWLSF